jgi:hypothetical protein
MTICRGGSFWTNRQIFIKFGFNLFFLAASNFLPWTSSLKMRGVLQFQIMNKLYVKQSIITMIFYS